MQQIINVSFIAFFSTHFSFSSETIFFHSTLFLFFCYASVAHASMFRSFIQRKDVSAKTNKKQTGNAKQS